MPRKAWGILLALMLAASACDSDDPNPNPSPSPSPSPSASPSPNSQKVVFTTGSQHVQPNNCSGAVNVAVESAATSAPQPAAATIFLTPSITSGSVYSDSSCSTVNTGLVISAGQSGATLYFKVPSPGTITITLVASDLIPTISQDETSSSSNFGHIKTAIIDYAIAGYATSLQPTIMSWMAQRYDFVIGGSVDPRPYNPNDTWTAYVDSAFVYANQIYSTVKASASSHGFVYEDSLLHTNQDYQVSSSLGWQNLSQFDAFEQATNITGTSGDPTLAINGAFLLNGTQYTDITANSYDGSFQISVTDRLLLGYAEPFDQVNFIVSTGATQTVTWQYWNGTQWSALTPVSDSSAGLSKSGQVLFVPPSGWKPVAVNGSHVKYWVQATVSGSGTAPTVSKIYGDDWIAHTGSNNGRGWSTTDSHRVNVGLGNLEYNPTPPSSATAKFRYQARMTGVWAPNACFGNPGNIQNSAQTWAFVLEDEALARSGNQSSPDGIMFDDGLTTPTPISPTSSIGSYTDLGSDTWIDYGLGVYTAVVVDLHSVLGSQYQVGSNTPYQVFADLGNWSLDEEATMTTRNELAPIALGSLGTGQTAGQTYDGYLPANNPNGTLGMMSTSSDFNQGLVLSDGTWEPWDEANRAPIDALATYYVSANPDTYFLYNAFGSTYVETDEFYYWSAPTQTTATIAANTSGGSKTITATDVSAFATLAIEKSIVVKLGNTGEVVFATFVNNTTLTTTNPIHFSYPVGTQISYAILAHQSNTALQPLSNIWKWGPWFPAIAVDVGVPDPNGYNGGNRDLNWMSGPAASGNPGACGSVCSPIWRRDYTNAIVLTRTLTYNSPASEVTTLSVPIILPGTYYPLNADGTTGPAVTTIKLRGGDSAILMKTPTN